MNVEAAAIVNFDNYSDGLLRHVSSEGDRRTKAQRFRFARPTAESRDSFVKVSLHQVDSIAQIQKLYHRERRFRVNVKFPVRLKIRFNGITNFAVLRFGRRRNIKRNFVSKVIVECSRLKFL